MNDFEHSDHYNTIAFPPEEGQGGECAQSQQQPSSSSSPPHQSGDYTDMSVGEILKRTRTYYDQEIEDIEKALNIGSTQLRAIENNEFHKLPGRVYAIGFVRSYSEYLGLDGDKMVKLLKMKAFAENSGPELQFPVSVDDSKSPGKFIILLSLAGLALVIFIWAVFFSPGKKEMVVPPVPPQMKEKAETAEITMQPASNSPSPDNTALQLEISADNPDDSGAGNLPPATQPSPEPTPTAQQPADNSLSKESTTDTPDMILNIKEKSWVEIKDASGASILKGTLKAGEQYEISYIEGMTMSTGNAGGLEIVINGEAIPPLGRSGQVIHGISLDPEKLLSTAGRNTE